MPKNRSLRKLLLASKGSIIQPPKSASSIKQRSNVSLACTECQKKKSKCSGTIPCTRCITEKCDCIYNPLGDRRSKAYIAELLGFHAALCRIVTTLRSGNSDEISWLMWEMQIQQTDQEAIRYLTEGYQMNPVL
ncbi:hypothetical protein N7520_001628 [Penicillium odoratum]|uniref:uncharacterized protein n=1 Tax=Penicillium odoratum TaxID=1167516 RepID=UPI0025473B50|nr:uncharacterized protein N7520_001628 [Penicillium odoratum]KAJ5778382.1 hypothetical protein N7520_001628 [Penicillium odoratum]